MKFKKSLSILLLALSIGSIFTVTSFADTKTPPYNFCQGNYKTNCSMALEAKEAKILYLIDNGFLSEEEGQKLIDEMKLAAENCDGTQKFQLNLKDRINNGNCFGLGKGKMMNKNF